MAWLTILLRCGFTIFAGLMRKVIAVADIRLRYVRYTQRNTHTRARMSVHVCCRLRTSGPLPTVSSYIVASRDPISLQRSRSVP